MGHVMEWWTILLFALLCSLPASLLLWAAVNVGKRGDEWAEDDDSPTQNIAAQPIKPQTD